MVNYQSSGLDRTFGAIADPARRAILSRLERKPGYVASRRGLRSCSMRSRLPQHSDLVAAFLKVAGCRARAEARAACLAAPAAALADFLEEAA